VTNLLIAVGARPNFMKAASVATAAERSGLTYALVHTGQHYDPELSRVFFDDLELPTPDVYLGVGSAGHAVQTGRIMVAFEPELRRINPAIVVVVGDVNSTLACALTANKEGYPVAHVEAGLRSYDPRMPEEINRRLCDHLATYLFTTSIDGNENLEREGIPSERVFFVGNTMIDTLLRFSEAARKTRAAAHLGVEGKDYVVVTLHRPATVDSRTTLVRVLEAIRVISRCAPVVFPLHPRTRHQLAAHGLDRQLANEPNLILCDALGYLEFTGLLAGAKLVLTDSGGIQEETTVLGVPCLTVRESTERPVTVWEGTNQVVGTESERIVEEALTVLEGRTRAARIPDLWDGRAGERIVERLRSEIYEGLPAASSVA
jgi:UDP-N-acetylglucosamine 2-epimerase (non-hydrolysing)